MARETEVRVPDIGDYKNVPVIEILVKVGDRVEKDAALMTLESEKATMEVPAPAAGIVRSIKAKVGDKVSQNDVLMALEVAEAAASPPKPLTPALSPQKTRGEGAAQRVPSPAKAGEGQGEGAKASPPSPPTPLPQAGEGSKTIAVTVPDIGDYHDVPVIEVLVSEGATVEKDAPLIVLESEKSTMEVPAPVSGTVRKLAVKAGMKVSKGAPICELMTAGAAPSASVPSPARAGEGQGEGRTAPKPSPPTPLPQTGEGSSAPWVGQAKSETPHASPYVRKLAREFGVDLAKVAGSGPQGRITGEDVQGYTKRALSGGAPGAASGGAGIPQMPAVDFSQFGEIEHKPLARIRKLSAQYLHRAWLNVPHVTQFEEADITELDAFRKAQSEETGMKLTLLPFLMKAVSAAMKQFPDFNASLAPGGEGLILKKYCNIGFAADTENGLVVPVVKDVWSKGIVALANDCAELAKKARDGKLKPDEMKGGCFSISSLGGIGGSHFTPIVNAPEVAILGVSRAQMKPVWDGKEFTPRLMCPLSLSYDHRVIDGAYAARFIVALGKSLSDLRRTLL